MSGWAARVSSFKVGRFDCEVSLPNITPGSVTAAVVEWSPHVPDFYRDLTVGQRSEYQAKLMAVVAEMSAE